MSLDPKSNYYDSRINFKLQAARDAEKIAIYSALLEKHYSEETPTTME